MTGLQKKCLIYIRELGRIAGTQGNMLSEDRMHQLPLLQPVLLNPK